MNTIERLEALKRIIEGTQNTPYQYPGEFTRGITTGLRIALKAVDDEIQSARNFEAALAKLSSAEISEKPPVFRVPQPRMVERKCAWCKGPFLARVVDVKRGWGKFCSKSCKANKQEKRTGQYRAYQAGQEERDHQQAMDDAGHIFAGGYFGHGQN